MFLPYNLSIRRKHCPQCFFFLGVLKEDLEGQAGFSEQEGKWFPENPQTARPDLPTRALSGDAQP